MPHVQTSTCLNVIGISGSPSLASNTAVLVDHVLRRLSPGSALPHIRLSQLDTVALVRADVSEQSVEESIRSVDRADGIIIASPIYKASFSGLLKLFLDLLPQYALTGKVVLPLATGGSPAHVLALDYALRPVLHAMGARHVVQSVFLRSADIAIGDSRVDISSDAAALLNEAILHFEQAVNVSISLELLGHPRPTQNVVLSALSVAS